MISLITILSYSHLQDLFIVMQAADIDAMDVTVTEMSNILTVFDIAGAGTTAVLEDIVISSNNIAQTKPNNLWVGIHVREGAVGSITNSSFIVNTNMRHVFSATTTATLDIQSSSILGAAGGRVVVSLFESCIVLPKHYLCRIFSLHHILCITRTERARY
jgi:hypothetical protein